MFYLWFHHFWWLGAFLHNQIVHLHCQRWLTSLLFRQLGLLSLRRNSCITQKPRSVCFCFCFIEHLNLVLCRTGQLNHWEFKKQCMLCSLTFNLISLPNLHPLWPDHTSVNVDRSAGSLTFSLTLNHSVMTSDRDHIQPRLAANCPQLHLGFTTKLSLRHHSAFISDYDCICSLRRFDIRIFLDSHQNWGCSWGFVDLIASKIVKWMVDVDFQFSRTW